MHKFSDLCIFLLGYILPVLKLCTSCLLKFFAVFLVALDDRLEVLVDCAQLLVFVEVLIHLFGQFVSSLIQQLKVVLARCHLSKKFVFLFPRLYKFIFHL